MTMSVVVVLLPVLDDHPCFEEAVEFVHVQALVANTVVEGFDVPVLPWLTWWNVADTNLVFTECPECLGDEFGPVVAPQHLRWAASACERLPQRGDEILCRDGSLDNVQHGLAGVFVDHRRDLEFPAVGGRIELEVDRPPTFGAPASVIGVVEAPARLRIFRTFTRNPSSRQRRCTFFLLITQPAARKSAHARRNPFLWFALAQSRNHFRRSTSGSSEVFLATFLRWVDRGCPTILQANRCESPIVCWSIVTAFRLAVGLRIFPSRSP